MRIHRLEISAFGPFAGTEHIDFDRLGARGLFLLNGPTGAGKTSVLDAICFALYGSVPGARQDGKRPRSDHAEAAAEPRVSCEFSAKGRHFEVSRSPAWDKPSARGRHGFTVQQAKTLLRERVKGTWVEKSSRNDEAGAEITDLLGMNQEQFTRVVMLPQGEFAAFLRAKATDRLELLQSLFGTQRFEAVAQELARKAQAARTEVASLNNQLELLLARAEAETDALGLDSAGSPGRDDPAALLAWLQGRAAAVARERQAAAEEAEVRRADQAAELDAATARAARQERLAAAERRRSAADSAAPALAAMTDTLGLHRRAEMLTGQLEAVEHAAGAEEESARALAGAVADLQSAALSDPELGGLAAGDLEHPDGDALRGALGRLRAVGAVLAERLPEESSLAVLKARLTTLRTTLGQLTADSRAGAAALAGLRTEAAGLLAGLHPLEELAAELPLRAKETAAAGELVAVVGRHGEAEAAWAGVAERHRLAREEHQDRRQRWLDLREERLTNAAAELATQLLAGVPCPVCGSPEHPAPAPAAASALAVAEAEQNAQEACEAAEAALAVLERQLAEAQQEVAVLAAQGGNTAPEEARRAAAEAKERAAEAAAAVEELASSRARQAGLAQEITAAEQAQADAATGIAQTQSAIAEVLAQADSLETALQTLRSGHPGLAERLQAVAGATDVLERAENARARLAQARTRTAEARQQLEQALPAAGFTSAAQARVALLPPADAAALEAAVRAGQDEAARVEELFAGEELALAARELTAGGPVGEDVLEELKAAASRAGREAREAALAYGLAEQSVLALARITAEYAGSAAAGREPRERAALLAALADAARGAGDNTYRMSLNSYVLAARLEQVAAAASERLIGMSDGRYRLLHSDAKAARGAKSGLGLEVVDEWTGLRRDTATLSGGESFMASLALALGLADVVQQEAGGVDIETLFVDEGFGSLDEQALEQVMDALEGLRDGGRVVGLVSHVGEMKQRISTQLQVVKGRNGSTLHICDDVRN